MRNKIPSLIILLILCSSQLLAQQKPVRKDWIKQDYFDLVIKVYEETDSTLRSIVDKYTKSCKEDKLTDIQTRYNPETNEFTILTFNCMDSEVASITLSSWSTEFNAISKLNNESISVKINKNQLTINNKDYLLKGQWRNTIYNSLLSGKYTISDSLHNIVAKIEIDSNGFIVDQNFIKRMNLYDYISGWDWGMWLKPTIENSDYIDMYITEQSRSYTYEMVKTEDGFSLYNRRTSVYQDSPNENPNYIFNEGLFYTFKRIN